MQSKPVVHYKKADFNGQIKMGCPAFIFPLDHTNHAPGQNVSNTCVARTSKVISVNHETGEFETLNTIYKLEKSK